MGASIVIQRALRGALAVLRVTRLRAARFEQELQSSDDIPIKLWVAHLALTIANHALGVCTIQWAVQKLERYGMRADPPRSQKRGLLAALLFVSTLNLEQLTCLGV